MNGLLKFRNIRVDRDGNINPEAQENIMEESESIEIVRFNAPSVSTTLSTYEELDEDELFDYEKVVIPFSLSVRDSIASTNQALIIEDGKIYLEDGTPESQTPFDKSFSQAEFKIATESKVYEISETRSSLSWINSQQPGLYSTPDGIYSVFKDKNGEMNYVLTGSDEVWFSPKKPGDAPILNEELSDPTLDTQAELEMSEEFQRMKRLLSSL